MHARLRHDVERWVDAGLISSDQAESIGAFEDTEVTHGSAFLAEGLGYVGAALAVGAGFLIAQNVWDDLPVAGRLSLIAVLTIAMFGGGWALRTRSTPAIQRLTDVLWLGTVVAAGAFAGIFASEVAGLVEESVGVAIGLTAAVIGGVLWVTRSRPLELIAFAGGLVVAIISGTSALFPDATPLLTGSVVWVPSAALFAAGHFNKIAPYTTAKVTGAVSVAFGSQIMAIDSSIPGSAIAVATAAILVVYAVRQRDDLMLAISGIMVLLFVPQFIFAVFGESLGAPVGLFVTGIALVVIAISITKARSVEHRG